MSGIELIAKLCDHWRKLKTQDKPVVFVLDEGGRRVALRLLEIKHAKKGENVVTVFELRRIAE